MKIAATLALALVFVGSATGHTTNAAGRDAVSVVKALKAKGVPIDRYVNYTASTDRNSLLGRPGQYTHKVNFHDRRLKFDSGYDTDHGGSVETFASKTDAINRFKYVDAITRGSALFAEYHWLKATVFLRVSGKLTPAQAAKYKRAFFAT